MSAQHPPYNAFLRACAVYLRARWVGWAFLALLASVAFFSARLALTTVYKAPRSSVASQQKHAPDFTVSRFTVWRSSLDGASEYQFSGDSLVRYRDDLSAVVVKPSIAVSTLTQNPSVQQHRQVLTTIRAERGLMRNDGELFQFMGDVTVQRTAGAQPSKTNAQAGTAYARALSTLQSDSLVLLPDVDRVSTRSAVTVTQGAYQSIAKGGLDYAHADASLQLLGGVRSVIPAQK